MVDSKKSILAWSFYDWANSAFATTVMAGFFPVFFKEYWSTTDNVTLSTWYLGLANSTASILIAALSPFLGAIADQGTAKKKLLILFAFIGIISTGALWIVQQGSWQVAILFYVIASVGFMGGNIFYDSEDTYNSSVLLNRDGIQGFYHKRQLVPLAEHFPFSENFDFLKNINIG